MSIEYLRRETRRNHQRLEDRLDIRTRCATVPTYRRLLERFYGFYHPYEAALKRSNELFPPVLDMEARTRLPQLASDLQTMGVTADQRERLTQCPDVPQPRTSAEALGCLYVSEGSTLGGQVIRRMVQEIHGGDAPPTAFFNGYGAQTGMRWRSLCAAIDGAALSNADQEAMAQAACDLFQTLEAWLCDEADHWSQKEQ